MTPTELAWAAGLFEGEGTIRINKPSMRNWGTLCASVVNTDSDVTDFFQARWPGYLKPCGVSKPNHRPAWMWVIAAHKAVEFLRAIRPYVVRRRVIERIDHGLYFQAQKRMDVRSMTARERYEYAEAQWAAYWWMCHLNERGVRPEQVAA